MKKKVRTSKMNAAEKRQFIKSVLSDLGQEIISRRDPEYLYTAAYIGASGAIVWGVSVLKTVKIERFWMISAAGILLIIMIGLFICLKISREYKQYCKARVEQARLVKILIDKLHVDGSYFPLGIRKMPERGHCYSIAIIIIASIGASVFCFVLCFL